LRALVDVDMNSVGATPFPLPPLILHPFTSSEESSLLAESSKASLALQGLARRGEAPLEDLDQKLLRGRYAELRMLFYIGKDISRWAQQCAETAFNSNRRLRPETFVISLVQFAPRHVATKLEGWGVLDYKALFRRSFGLHAVFEEFPAVGFLSNDFLRRYHRYLDQWYEQRLRDFVFDLPEAGEFVFDLFASGEYTSMLEKSWKEDSNEQPLTE
jgi:hypothetical protein